MLYTDLCQAMGGRSIVGQIPLYKLQFYYNIILLQSLIAKFEHFMKYVTLIFCGSNGILTPISKIQSFSQHQPISTLLRTLQIHFLFFVLCALQGMDSQTNDLDFERKGEFHRDLIALLREKDDHFAQTIDKKV